jgi:16S rRNA G966 N2-methylase RsmD
MTAQALLSYTTDKFDLIFIDPPYNSGLINEILPLTANVLTENGTIIVEDEKSFLGSVDGLIRYDERKYGRVYLTFFKREI